MPILSCLAVLMLISMSTQGQSPLLPDHLASGYRISFKPLQAIFLDFPVVVERQFGRHGAVIELSYRMATSDSAEITPRFSGIGDSYFWHSYFNPLNQAVTISVGYKYYFLKRFRHKFFINPNLFYRLWWVDDKWAKYDAWFDHQDFEGHLTERKHVFGVKFLAGKTFLFLEGKKVMPLLEFYVGVGVRGYRYVHDIRDGMVAGQAVGHHRKSGWSAMISPQLGFRLGFATGFRKAEKE